MLTAMQLVYFVLTSFMFSAFTIFNLAASVEAEDKEGRCLFGLAAVLAAAFLVFTIAISSLTYYQQAPLKIDTEVTESLSSRR